jgi:hypothetical protein
MKPWREIRSQKLSEEQLEQLDAELEQDLINYEVQILRVSLGLPVEEPAFQDSYIAQKPSQTEERLGKKIVTLKRYIEPLGGTLHFTAVVNGKHVNLLQNTEQ